MSLFNFGAKSPKTAKTVVYVDSPYLDGVISFLRANYGKGIKIISDPEKTFDLAVVDPYSILSSPSKIRSIRKNLLSKGQLIAASFGSSHLGRIQIPEMADQKLKQLNSERLEEDLAPVIALINKIKATV